MKTEHPKISVIVPTYNRAELLRGCIDAVLSQTMNDFELIIVSDGSTDDTERVVSGYEDPRITFLKKENGGQASARNLGISESSGDHISLCDDDDRFYPDHLSTLSTHLDKDPGPGLVYADSLWRYRNSETRPDVKFSRDFDKKALENYNYITPLNVMFRRSCLRNTELFNEDPGFKGLEDWDFFLRLSDAYPFLHVKRVTSEYNVHESNSFSPGSTYDYNGAFLLVRKQRLQHLISEFGPLLFDHVDQMYPYHLVQSYLNNGLFHEGLKATTRLQQIHEFYNRMGRERSITELVILFSLGISSFAAGYEKQTKNYFNDILNHSIYNRVEKPFIAFTGQYADGIVDVGLKILLKCFFGNNTATKAPRHEEIQ